MARFEDYVSPETLAKLRGEEPSMDDLKQQFVNEQDLTKKFDLERSIISKLNEQPRPPLVDRLKSKFENVGNILSEPAEYDELDNSYSPTQQMAGQGLMKVVRSAAELMPDDEDYPIAFLDPTTGEPVRMDPGGLGGAMGTIKKGVKTVAKAAAKKALSAAASEAKEAKSVSKVASKPKAKSFPKEDLTGINTKKLKELQENNYHNPDTGLDLVPEAVDRELAKRAGSDKKIEKAIADYKRRSKIKASPSQSTDSLQGFFDFLPPEEISSSMPKSKNTPNDFIMVGDGKLTTFNPAGTTELSNYKSGVPEALGSRELSSYKSQLPETIGSRELAIDSKKPEVIGSGIKRSAPLEEPIEASLVDSNSDFIKRLLKGVAGAGISIGGLMSLLSPKSDMKKQAPFDALALEALKYQDKFGGSSKMPEKDSLLSILRDTGGTGETAQEQPEQPEQPEQLTPEQPEQLTPEQPEEKSSSILDQIIPSASAEESMPDMPPSVRQAMPDMPPPAKAREEAPEEAPGFTESSVENLRKLQEEAKRERNWTRLAEAAAMMRSGALGSQYKVAPPDISEYRKMLAGMREEADQPIADFKARIEQEKFDPKSARSVNARNLFRKLMKDAGVQVKIPDNSSEDDLVKRFPILENIIKTREASAARKEELEVRRQTELEKKKMDIEQEQKELEIKMQDRSLERESKEKIVEKQYELAKELAIVKTQLGHENKEKLLDKRTEARERLMADSQLNQASKQIQTSGGTRGNDIRAGLENTARIFSTLGVDPNKNFTLEDAKKIKPETLDKATKMQVVESAVELNRLLAGRGVPAASTLQKLIPDNVDIRVADLQQKLTSKPTEAEQGAYLKQIIEIAARMRDYLKLQNLQLNQQLIPGFSLIKKYNPEGYKDLLTVHNLMDIDEYKDYLKSKEYKQFNPKADTKESKEGKEPKKDFVDYGGTRYHVGDIIRIKGKKYQVAGTDPNDPNSLKEIK